MLRIMTLREAASRDARDPARGSRLPLRRATSACCKHACPQV